MKLTAKPLGVSSEQAAISGIIRVPGDKSISHRSIMFGSLAEGTTHVSGFLEGADALATLQAFRDMGVDITDPVDGELRIQGVGMHGLEEPVNALDLGNSGTSMRLLAGLLAGQSFDLTMIGDESLSKRPMERVAKPLRQMGAVVETAEGGKPPMKLKGRASLKAIDYKLPMASAQVKSCVLLAGMFAEGETRVEEPAPTRDHTERMLNGFGYEVKTDGNVVTLKGGGKLTACNIDIPSDISSAAFFLVAAAIGRGSKVTLTHVGINPTRTGVIDILKLMGAKISLLDQRDVGGEPVADIEIEGGDLQGISVPENLVPLAIDEFPAIFVAAACANGTTVVTGAEELRVKESDRIQAMIDGLLLLGVNCEATEDGAIIHGVGSEGVMVAQNGGDLVEIDCHHDHRIAMSFAIASLRSATPIEVPNCDNILTSFPNFAELANSLGYELTIE